MKTGLAEKIDEFENMREFVKTGVITKEEWYEHCEKTLELLLDKNKAVMLPLDIEI